MAAVLRSLASLLVLASASSFSCAYLSSCDWSDSHPPEAASWARSCSTSSCTARRLTDLVFKQSEHLEHHSGASLPCEMDLGWTDSCLLTSVFLLQSQCALIVIIMIGTGIKLVCVTYILTIGHNNHGPNLGIS